MWQPSWYTRLQGTEKFQSFYQDGISIKDFKHIKSVLAPTLDLFQFAYRSNRSNDDATAFHHALTQLDKKDLYVRMLFIDFSSAFNTIIPQ